ncbi:MAG: bacteriohemerythrin [Nitrospirae bacterium]|nr:bacteriohemerythrin [Nitrospirota bacterium]
MGYIEWGIQFSVNVPELDEQHKKLFDMTNELSDAIEAKRGRESLEKTISDLLEYTKTHFDAEEGYLRKYGYPDYKNHCMQHNNLNQQTFALFLKYENGEDVSPEEVLNFLKSRLLLHILIVDMKYSLFLKEEGKVAGLGQVDNYLTESKHRLIDIIDFFPDPTFVVDNDKKVIIWNVAMEAMTGVSRAEIIGKGDYAYTVPFYGEKRKQLLDLLDGNDANIAARYKDIKGKGNIMYAETFCPALYGGRGAYVWATVAPLFDEKGIRVGAIETIRDITEQVKAKEALHNAYTEMELRVQKRTAALNAVNTALTAEITDRVEVERRLMESEDKFRSIFEQAIDGIMIADPVQKRNIEANRAICGMLGYTRDEIITLGVKDLHPKEELPRIFDLFARQLRGEISLAPDVPMLRKDGSVLYVDINATPVLLGGKKCLIGIFRDITRRKKAEKELRMAHEQLEVRVLERTSELNEITQRFQLAAASGQLGVWDWYVPSDFMVWNDRMLELYGISGEDFPNSIQAWINSLHPDDSAKAMGECEAALRGEKEFDTEFRVMHADGTVKVLKANAIVIRDADGKPVRMLGLNRDVTEVRKMTSELNKSNEQLRNLTAHLHSVREEERTRIAREIHDELGQALTAQKMELSWLRDKYGDHKAIYEKTGAMLDALNATIRSVKLICTELRPSILDDFGLIDAMQWQANEFQTKTRIECAVETLHKDIQVDKDRSTVLFRIFQETLTNVLKHARATKVTARLAKDNDNIVLEVTDNGKGITDKELSKHQSFGLIGMRERVHPWGGKVEIAGYKNRGTTVKVSMPHLV